MKRYGYVKIYPTAEEEKDIEIGRIWRDLNLLNMESVMDYNTRISTNREQLLKRTLTSPTDTLCYCCNSILNTFKHDNNMEMNDNNLRLYKHKEYYYTICLECYRKLNMDNNMNLYIENLRKDIIEYDSIVDYIDD